VRTQVKKEKKPHLSMSELAKVMMKIECFSHRQVCLGSVKKQKLEIKKSNASATGKYVPHGTSKQVLGFRLYRSRSVAHSRARASALSCTRARTLSRIHPDTQTNSKP
jgi:hypothetical protein